MNKNVKKILELNIGRKHIMFTINNSNLIVDKYSREMKPVFSIKLSIKQLFTEIDLKQYLEDSINKINAKIKLICIN